MRHIATLVVKKKLTQDGIVRITEILGVSNPADLGPLHLDARSIRRALERCHCYIREGRPGNALRSEMQEIMTKHAKSTRSQKRKRSPNSIVHESSDAVPLKQLRDQML